MEIDRPQMCLREGQETENLFGVAYIFLQLAQVLMLIQTRPSFWQHQTSLTTLSIVIQNTRVLQAYYNNWIGPLYMKPAKTDDDV